MMKRLEAFMRRAAQDQNLVSPADLAELWDRQILDSLAPWVAFKQLRLQRQGTWIDIGSGSGFPLLPMAITLPHWTFISIEPRTLRAQHLRTATAELELSNIRVYCAKSESLTNFPELNRKADIVSTRAVGKIPEDAQRAFPFLAPSGIFLTYKHQEMVTSIDGYHPLSYVPYRLPRHPEERTLVLATLSQQANP